MGVEKTAGIVNVVGLHPSVLKAITTSVLKDHSSGAQGTLYGTRVGHTRPYPVLSLWTTYGSLDTYNCKHVLSYIFNI